MFGKPQQNLALFYGYSTVRGMGNPIALQKRAEISKYHTCMLRFLAQHIARFYDCQSRQRIFILTCIGKKIL